MCLLYIYIYICIPAYFCTIQIHNKIPESTSILPATHIPALAFPYSQLPSVAVSTWLAFPLVCPPVGSMSASAGHLLQPQDLLGPRSEACWPCHLKGREWKGKGKRTSKHLEKKREEKMEKWLWHF